jgi:hypothetical protein
MDLTTRTKLEIFAEAHAVGEIERMLRSVGFQGCSVFASVEGAGSHGAWRQTGVEEAGMRLVVTIGTQSAADAAIAWLEGYFATYPGVVAISEVRVLRAARF